jgi:hypothetical protein
VFLHESKLFCLNGLDFVRKVLVSRIVLREKTVKLLPQLVVLKNLKSNQRNKIMMHSKTNCYVLALCVPFHGYRFLPGLPVLKMIRLVSCKTISFKRIENLEKFCDFLLLLLLALFSIKCCLIQFIKSLLIFLLKLFAERIESVLAAFETG